MSRSAHHLDSGDERSRASCFGTVAQSKVTPSTRKRTRRSPSRGSKWMSDAPRSTALAMIAWTSFTTGASFADCARSSITRDVVFVLLVLDLVNGFVELR